ncbi:TrbI/VirB10 family protein [Acidicapsa dinghuensis]|uniref:TrbI/VirB10 family protein n=1 Tax=Acidicapsa dinghuensis TaxID=2218256 RepID=A0ABW1EGB0_9BACT|nr:TrbI/VirB10 family protein [Acidicapsa dinghuensis]
MSTSELNRNEHSASSEEALHASPANEVPRPQPPAVPAESQTAADQVAQSEPSVLEPAAISEIKPGLDKNRALLLGGGLATAVLFFVFTMLVARQPHKGAATLIQQPQQGGAKPLAGIAPLMKPVNKPETADNDGQLTLDDIKRMRSPDSSSSAPQAKRTPYTSKAAGGNESLAAVPSFAETQQKWEEPRPYGESRDNRAPAAQQEQALLKESSIVFVRTQTQSQTIPNSSTGLGTMDEPFLDVTPGSRILAKLKTEISTADATLVVAQVEYTYAIGDQTILPAGAEIYGHIQQADRAGNVSVKFEEVDLLDGSREKIEAVGKGLDMGPIKGKVYGKNTGKNLLVRSVSGIGSTLAMVFGNNTSSAFSEDDLIRERLAENIGTAGDSEIMNMALNSREYVSVPAETRIYVVFTKHEEGSPTLHKVGP